MTARRELDPHRPRAENESPQSASHLAATDSPSPALPVMSSTVRSTSPFDPGNGVVDRCDTVKSAGAANTIGGTGAFCAGSSDGLHPAINKSATTPMARVFMAFHASVSGSPRLSSRSQREISRSIEQFDGICNSGPEPVFSANAAACASGWRNRRKAEGGPSTLNSLHRLLGAFKLSTLRCISV